MTAPSTKATQRVCQAAATTPARTPILRPAASGYQVGGRGEAISSTD